MPANDLMLIQVLGLFCASCAVYFAFRIGTRISARCRLSLPPGPKGYPVIGNLLDMPARTTQNWKKYAEWGEQYGVLELYPTLDRFANVPHRWHL